MKTLKSENRRFYTPTHTLFNESSGREVTLVGMMHIGDVQYYERVSELLKEKAAAGNEIHYEYIKPSTFPLDKLPEVEREDLTHVRSHLKDPAVKKMASMLGLSSQKTQVVYPEGSKNIDFDDLTLFRRLGWERTKKMFITKAREDSGEESEMETKILKALMSFTFSNYDKVSKVIKLLPGGRHTFNVILNERNDVAFRAARRRLNEGDVTLVWGAAHLPGLVKSFQREGFTVVNTRWLKACDMN